MILQERSAEIFEDSLTVSVRNHLNSSSDLTNVVLLAGITDKVVLGRDMTRKNDDFENARSTVNKRKPEIYIDCNAG